MLTQISDILAAMEDWARRDYAKRGGHGGSGACLCGDTAIGAAAREQSGRFLAFQHEDCSKFFEFKASEGDSEALRRNFE